MNHPSLTKASSSYSFSATDPSAQRLFSRSTSFRRPSLDTNGLQEKSRSRKTGAVCAIGGRTQKLRYRGTPHTYIMAGVMRAEVKHVRMMLVAVAPPIP
eukprot:6122849-Pyramimonas_sp.AAC.1